MVVFDLLNLDEYHKIWKSTAIKIPRCWMCVCVYMCVPTFESFRMPNLLFGLLMINHKKVDTCLLNMPITDNLPGLKGVRI